MDPKTKTRLKETQFREVTISRDESGDPIIDMDARTVKIAISSEEPYERWGELEILDHDPKAIRLDRLRNDAPFLFSHDTFQQIGVILPETVELGEDKVLRATAKISRSELGEEMLIDMADGIRKKISVGYKVHNWEQELDEKGDATNRYHVTDWTPMEASLVPVPADDTVGLGRQQVIPEVERAIVDQSSGSFPSGDRAPFSKEVHKMDPTKTQVAPTPEATPTDDHKVIELKAAEAAKAAGQAETDRIRQIEATVAQIPGMGHRKAAAVADGMPAEQFNREAIQFLASADSAGGSKPKTDLGLTEKEVRKYSLIRLIGSMVPNAGIEAGFEREMSSEIAKRLGRPARGAFIPNDIQRRDLSAGVDTQLVGTAHLGGSFIEMLRAFMAIRTLGATVLSGLRDTVTIPRQATGATAAWITPEGNPAAETEPTFSLLTLTPKTVGTFTDITRQLLLQSDPSVDGIVQRDLAIAAAQAIDIAAINGSGAAGQPTGILQTAGIGDVAGGVNGLAPAWTHLVNLWKQVAQDNALVDQMAFLINAVTAGKLMEVEKAAGTAKFLLEEVGGPILGYPAVVSNNVPSNLVKGASGAVCSAIIFGNFRDLILAEWGELDILVDPYTASSSGTVRTTVFQSVDVGVRNAPSFAAMKDALTV